MSTLSAVEGLFGSFSHYLYKIPDHPQQGKIGNFTRKIYTDGTAFNHLFMVSIKYTKGSWDSDSAEHVALLCHAATVPALNVMTNHYRENEAHYEVPYGISYEPVTLHFYSDVKLRIKALFDAWYDNITSSRAFPTLRSKSDMTNRIKFLDDFVADVIITVLDRQTNSVYSVTLRRAWPKSIGNIDMNAQNTDVVSFPVQFVYERLEIVPFAGLGALEATGVPFSSLNGLPISIVNTASGTASELMQNATGYSPDQIQTTLSTATTSINDKITDIRGSVQTALTLPSSIITFA